MNTIHCYERLPYEYIKYTFITLYKGALLRIKELLILGEGRNKNLFGTLILGGVDGGFLEFCEVSNSDFHEEEGGF